ncbi:MAG TPA: CHAT domain-containing tetratricopeptide repeat protein [Gaiellaceae bacterium]
MTERAHALVQTNPVAARNLAEQALALARAERDREARAAALHVLGWAQADLGDARALRTLRAALRAAERGGDRDRAARVRRNVARHMAYRGNPVGAIREIEEARSHLRGLDLARSEVFRVVIYHLADRTAEALPASEKALHTLRGSGDDVWEARLSFNRGVVLAEIGDHVAARDELERARDLYSSLGFDVAAAEASIELGLLPSLAGDPLRSLIELEAIDTAPLSDFMACWLNLNRAEALLRLRLLPEARADLMRFEATLARSGHQDNKARLDAARLALAAGDPDTAATIAASAKRSFAARQQPAFAAAAQLVRLAADVARGTITASAIRSGRAAAETLAERGWRFDALRGRLLVARAAAVNGSVPLLCRELDAARPLERKGTVIDRVELRHLEALLLLRKGDAAGGERRLRAGLDLLESYRAALGSLEVRATTGAFGVDLARAGLAIALESGNPERILAWAERLRASALRFPAVRPPADPQLRAAQAELRALSRRAHAAEGRGRPVAALLARQSDLEESIRARSRLVRSDAASRWAPPDLRAVARTLESRVLVEFVEGDGRLHATTLTHGSLSLHDLGEIDVSADLDWMRFALRRLARGGLDGASRATTLANARAAADALGRQLLSPLRDAIGDAPLVIVPTGPLHAVPWGALPSLRGRPVSVAPSLSTWLDHATRARRRRPRVVLAAGPGLRHARAEINELRGLFDEPAVLTGKDATVEATLTAIDGATLAHVACHGRFRADSPLFSSLELADGPLTALDIQGLRRAPDILVLSACDVALSERHPGDELLGLSAALIASGTRTIVASVVPVPDAAARRLMLAFHRTLVDGAPPAVALADAQAGLRAERSALAGFLCLGVG